MNIKPALYVRTMFLRDKRQHPTGCLAIVVDHENHIAQYQLSVLNPMDQFDRKMSRLIAKGRLIECPYTVILPRHKTSMHEVSTLIMNDIVKRGVAPHRAIKSAKLWLDNNLFTEADDFANKQTARAELTSFEF